MGQSRIWQAPEWVQGDCFQPLIEVQLEGYEGHVRQVRRDLLHQRSSLQEERGSCGVCQEKGHGILHSKIRGKGAERQEDQADSRSFKVLGVSLQIQVWLQEQIEIVKQGKRKESFQEEQVKIRFEEQRQEEAQVEERE